MVICEKCRHFRRIRPPSQLFAAEIETTDAAVTNALNKIGEDEGKQREAEAQFRSRQELAGREEWNFRPIMSVFCGLREAEGEYLILEVKNHNLRCDKYKSEPAPTHSCLDCAYRVKSQGAAQDQGRQLAYTKLAGHFHFSGSDWATNPTMQWAKQHSESIGPQKAFELEGAYRAKGILAIEPRYLDYCAYFSKEGEYHICVMQNPHATCPAWKRGELQQPRPGKMSTPASNSDTAGNLLKAVDALVAAGAAAWLGHKLQKQSTSSDSASSTASTNVCPVCRYENQRGWRFCANCGRQLSTS